MDTQKLYCSACGREVRVAWTSAPLHGGQATLPDAPELICLDLEQNCSNSTSTCPVTGLSRVVMSMRRARSEFVEVTS
jgi:hypothetical protein